MRCKTSEIEACIGIPYEFHFVFVVMLPSSITPTLQDSFLKYFIRLNITSPYFGISPSHLQN